jgi:hypothetical protein
MPIPVGTMEDLLVNSKMAISNAMSDDEIKTLLLEYNYDESRYNLGLELHKKAEELYKKQKKEYSEQYKASEELDKAYNAAKQVYREHVELTRLAFRNDPSQLVSLGIEGSMHRQFSAWLTQARQFYDNAINDEKVLEKISRYNVTKEKLEKGFQLISMVEVANNKQEKEKGEAQQFTKDRDKTMDDLADWIYEFSVVAKFALAEKPQLLEKLGIKVDS